MHPCRRTTRTGRPCTHPSTTGDCGRHTAASPTRTAAPVAAPTDVDPFGGQPATPFTATGPTSAACGGCGHVIRADKAELARWCGHCGSLDGTAVAGAAPVGPADPNRPPATYRPMPGPDPTLLACTRCGSQGNAEDLRGLHACGCVEEHELGRDVDWVGYSVTEDARFKGTVYSDAYVATLVARDHPRATDFRYLPGGHYRLYHASPTTMVAHVRRKDGRYVAAGYLTWFGGKPPLDDAGNPIDVGTINNGQIHKAYVTLQHRRKGLASAMLAFARDLHPDAHVRHSTVLSADGRAWAEAVV